jgi:predicted MFS family arabinose efflux permease
LNRYAALTAVALPPLVYGMFRFSIGVLVPKIESQYAINDSVMGLIVSISVGIVGIGVFASSSVAERYGERMTILLGLTLFSVPLIGVPFSASLVAFSLLVMMSSLGSGLFIPAVYGAVALLMPKRRGIGAGIVSSTYNVGGLLGPAVTGYLLLFFFWGVSFLVIALAGGISIVVFLVAFHGEMGGKTQGNRDQLGSVLRNRSVVVLALAALLADGSFVTYLTWTPEFLLRSFDVSGSFTAVVDLLFGIGIGLGGIGVFLAGFLLDKIGGRRSAALGGGVAALALVGVYLSGSLFASLLLMLVGSFFLNWFWSLVTVMSQLKVGAKQQSAATSLVQAAGFVGACAGPGLAGLLGGAEALPLVLTVVLPYVAYEAVIVFLYRD